MNEYIRQLASLDWVDLLVAVGIIVVGSVGIKEAIVKFCDSFDIEFGFVRDRKEMKECQNTVKQELKDLAERQERFEQEHERNIQARDKFNKEVVQCIDDLKQDIKDLADGIEKREAEKQFKKLRYDILNFADKISRCESVSAELIDQVFSEIKVYHELAEKYKFENGKVNVSVRVIEQKYEDLLMEGKIVKGD